MRCIAKVVTFTIATAALTGCIYVQAPPQDDYGYVPYEETNDSGSGASGGAPTSCTASWDECNQDRCGPPYRCYADGVIRLDPEGDTGETCGGPSDCENCSTGPWNALPCGTYTWAIGECHCVD